ncbi:MAG: hypothetical protein L3J47_03175 [Sulfurovum sp.]|nr:hypothetical protein [Sulfurovum sp.]
MQLIFIVFAGAVLGFLYGSYTDGFIFSTNICLFAGLTLIMPSLFKFKLKEILLVWEYKSVMLKGFVVNYILLPLFAVGVGLATGDFGIAAGLFLIAVLSGGGMVMHWIKRSHGDTSLGFLLLFINLIFVSLSLLMLHLFAQFTAPYFGVGYDEEVTIRRFAQPVIMLLIVIPFIASRVILFLKPLVGLIEKYRKFISQGSIFVILFYLFGLQSSQQLVDIYDFEPELFFVAFGATVLFYALTIAASTWIYNLDSPQERAAYWQSVTRYITLALVISTFSASTFGVSMLLPIMFAYLVQIPASVIIANRFMPSF